MIVVESDLGYQVRRDVKLPAGKILIPGVVSHATDLIEHSELVVDRLITFPENVGRENSTQQDGLRHSPLQILIDNAYKPIKWYLQLKKAWLASSESGQPFVNPVKGETLRWRT